MLFVKTGYNEEDLYINDPIFRFGIFFVAVQLSHFHQASGLSWRRSVHGGDEEGIGRYSHRTVMSGLGIT